MPLIQVPTVLVDQVVQQVVQATKVQQATQELLATMVLVVLVEPVV
jgi:hypothetical protein